MPIQILFAGTVAKHEDAPDDNEDVFRTAEAPGRIVVSDGASESFDARQWAGLIGDWLIADDPTDEGLAGCVHAYSQLHDPGKLTWSKAAAYERGSFATGLIAQDRPEDKAVRIASIGDCLAVWSDGAEMLATFPYTHAQQFDNKPVLLASRLDLNGTSGNACHAHWQSIDWPYAQHGYRILLCMTDAVGAWLLRDSELGDASAFERLCAVREHAEFVELVATERSAATMRRDDATLVTAIVTRPR